MDPVIDRITKAVVALSEGSTSKAERLLRAIDFQGLLERRTAAYARIWGKGGAANGYKRPTPTPGNRRRAPRAADVRATFTRDHYTCVYTHCRRPTVSVAVLRLLSRAFPDLLPYHPNWRPMDGQILYWTYSTSLEHRVPFPLGGDSSSGNLLTACYQCNDLKNYLPIEWLGWGVCASPPATCWAGLTEYIPLVRSASALLLAERGQPRAVTP